MIKYPAVRPDVACRQDVARRIDQVWRTDHVCPVAIDPQYVI
jgi:hypothetical protein